MLQAFRQINAEEEEQAQGDDEVVVVDPFDELRAARPGLRTPVNFPLLLPPMAIWHEGVARDKEDKDKDDNDNDNDGDDAPSAN